MEEFRFANPEYFWLLLGAGAMLVISVFMAKRIQEKLREFAHPKNLKWIAGSLTIKSLDRRTVFQILAFCFCILALARPQANPVLEDVHTEGLDIIVALDVSRSMDAEDVYPSRLRKAKKTIQTLLDRVSGDRVGIVAFAGSAFLICPLTSDYEVVRTFLQSIDTTLIDNQGTDIEAALSEATKAFQRGAENDTSAESPGHVVIIMSDGEETEGTAIKAAEKARENGTIVHALAYGTERGVPIPVRDGNGSLAGYKKDALGNTVVTKVNPSALAEIAKAGGGLFAFSSLDDSEVDAILTRTQDAQRKSLAQVQTKIYQEYFWFPLVIALVLLLVSFAPAWSLHSTTVLVLGCILLSSQAQAANLPWYSFLWNKEKRETETARQLLQENKGDEAAKHLQRLQADEPDEPRNNYNVGTTLAESGRLDEAEKTFANPQLAKDETAANASLFNQAGIAAKKENKDKAANLLFDLIRRLEGKEKPNETERALLAQAKKNLELVVAQPPQNKNQQNSKQDEQKQKDSSQQQKQQQSQQSQNGDQNKDKDQKQGQQKDERDKSQEEQKKDASGQDKQKQYASHKQPFQERQDLSEQDAKRILESLKNQETGLQKKLMKMQIGNQKEVKKENGKDW